MSVRLPSTVNRSRAKPGTSSKSNSLLTKVSNRKQKFIVPTPKTRGKGWTVYGGVSTCLRYRNSYFEIGKSTNKEEFKRFIENLGK